MKLFRRPLSLLLTVLLLLGTVSSLSLLNVSAAETETSTEETATRIDYTTKVFNSPAEKLATMQKYVTKDGYSLYVDAVSGEVAQVDEASGQVLFTNPYDVASSTGTVATKQQIMSQIIVKYTDNDTQKYFYSYEMASLRDQIKVKNIKNGVRVEYTIGREENKRLVPRLISVKRFQEKIAGPMVEAGVAKYDPTTANPAHNGEDGDYTDYGDISLDKDKTTDFYVRKFAAFYTRKSLSTAVSEQAKQDMIKAFPIVAKMDVYVFAPDAGDNDLSICEEQLKKYTTYSFEDMDYDHGETGYESEDDNPPVFKLALEYTLDSEGMTVRLPANGIRFNESLYQLTYISILPYMGAGNSNNTGYTFFPDGSGSLFRFEDLNTTTSTTLYGKVYGTDYAYHTIDGTYQQTIRYPVYGVVENQRYYDLILYGDDGSVTKSTTYSATIMDAQRKKEDALIATGGARPYSDAWSKANKEGNEIREYTVSNGYVAVMEEGEAMAELYTYHAGSLSDYNTIMLQVNPRPKDTYNIADSISVGQNSDWTVVSSRKYVGSYTIRYYMLTDEAVAKEKNIQNYHTATWFGMAEAYRDYLYKNGILSPLTSEDVGKDIPLYIETFGTLETTQKILSIPVNVMTPLTSFENIQTMYKELSESGVKNIKFKLTGYANGGMYSTVPYGLDWESAVGGKSGYQKLLAFAQQVTEDDADASMELYPDFDFVYVNATGAFDGLSLSKHAVKTIDDRYTSKRVYSATRQTYVSYYQLALSPAYFSNFYEKFVTKYNKVANTNISASTLGNNLNSDFDEDEPYNREDSKTFTAEALQYLSEKVGSVMTEGGNAFTWKYIDQLLGVALDSSRYIKSSNSVPFIGVVLHGAIQFTGNALNMEGDVNYAMLKAMENGASMYFILSYENTSELKEDYKLSKYYSVRYDIWKDDVIAKYLELNAVMNDVQTKLIIDHKFFAGERVPDSTEIDEDVLNELEDILHNEEAAEQIALDKKINAIANARKAAQEVVASVTAKLKKIYIESAPDKNGNVTKSGYLADIASNYNTAFVGDKSRMAKYLKALDTYNQYLEAAGGDEKNQDVINALADVETAKKGLLTMLGANIYSKYIGAQTEYLEAMALIEEADKAVEIIREAEGGDTLLVKEAADQVAIAHGLVDSLNAVYNLTEKTEGETYEEWAAKSIQNIYAATLEMAKDVFTEEQIIARYKDSLSSTGSNDKEEETSTETKYTVTENSGSIVLVTYGDKVTSGNGYTYKAYKSILMNYNNFAVRVTVNEIVYTLPAYGYAVIYN